MSEVAELFAWKNEVEKKELLRSRIDEQIQARLLQLEKEQKAMQQHMSETLDYCKLLAETQKKHGDHLEKRHDSFVKTQHLANERLEKSSVTLGDQVLNLASTVENNTKSNTQIHATVKAIGWVF